jgi:hypothetical protein
MACQSCYGILSVSLRVLSALTRSGAVEGWPAIKRAYLPTSAPVRLPRNIFADFFLDIDRFLNFIVSFTSSGCK